jgi:hypothetical protein
MSREGSKERGRGPETAHSGLFCALQILSVQSSNLKVQVGERRESSLGLRDVREGRNSGLSRYCLRFSDRNCRLGDPEGSSAGLHSRRKRGFHELQSEEFSVQTAAIKHICFFQFRNCTINPLAIRISLLFLALQVVQGRPRDESAAANYSHLRAWGFRPAWVRQCQPQEGYMHTDFLLK